MVSKSFLPVATVLKSLTHHINDPLVILLLFRGLYKPPGIPCKSHSLRDHNLVLNDIQFLEPGTSALPLRYIVIISTNTPMLTMEFFFRRYRFISVWIYVPVELRSARVYPFLSCFLCRKSLLRGSSWVRSFIRP
jgi:hypothetical protein